MGVPTSVRKAVAIDGTASVFQIPRRSSVMVQPGSGGTMTCQIRLHPDDVLVDIEPGTTSYSAAKVIYLSGPAYEVRFTAAVAEGAGSVAY